MKKDNGLLWRFADALIAANENGGSPVVRQMLEDIAPKDARGKTPVAYIRRAEAIVGALSDYLFVHAGTYQVQVVPAGASLEEGPVVIDAELTFEGGTLTTVAAVPVQPLLVTVTV
jgi:hypothetical protein